MVLFKPVKKPVIKSGTGSSEISPLRPRYTPKAAPCAGHCPNGNEIRELLIAIAQAETYGRTNEQAFELVWQRIAERNPFPAVCGRVCPHLSLSIWGGRPPPLSWGGHRTAKRKGGGAPKQGGGFFLGGFRHQQEP